MSTINKIDKDLYVMQVEGDFMTFQTTSKKIREFNDEKEQSNLNWTEDNFQNVSEDYYIFKYGANNDLPNEIRDVVYSSNMAPGSLTKKTNFLWGNGPVLYQKEIQNNEEYRRLVIDKEVQDWLDSFDYISYLLKCVIDYNYSESCFTKFNSAKSTRVGKQFFSDVEHISVKNARLAHKVKDGTNLSTAEMQPTHVVINPKGFGKIHSSKLKGYPLFDKREHFKNKQSILYSYLPAFAVDFYSLPDIYGTLEWIRQASSVPLLLKYMSKNGINIKYHIESPSIYWEEKEKELKADCESKKIKYNRKIFYEYRTALFQKIAEVLSGLENAGKFWHTVKIYDDRGTDLVEAGWTIKEIPQNIRDFIEGQIRISERADQAVSTGTQLHASLGGASQRGKADSGSEQLYASKIHLATSVNIPEQIVCEALNYAIKANWPKKNIKIGFSHSQINREQDVSPSERFTQTEQI